MKVKQGETPSTVTYVTWNKLTRPCPTFTYLTGYTWESKKQKEVKFWQILGSSHKIVLTEFGIDTFDGSEVMRFSVS